MPKKMKGLFPSVSRRSFVKMGAAAGGMAFAGYAPAVVGQTKELRFLNSEPSKGSVTVLNQAAAAYESETGVKVLIDSVGPGEAWQKLQASIAAGQSYDVSSVLFSAHVSLLADAGQLVGLNDLIAKHEWGPRILFPVEGNNYWYPFDYNLNWMFYRKDLYAEKGLKVPENQAEMLANCQALTEDNRFGTMHPLGSNSATQWMSLGYMWANQVSLLDDQFSVIVDDATNKPRMAAYLDFMKDLAPSMPPGMTQASFAEALAQYSSGQVAHAPYAGRLMEYLEDRVPELVENTGFFTYPSAAGDSRAVNHGYDGWVVLDTPMAEESLKFMDWFTSNYYVDFLHSAPLHFQPPRLDIYEDARWRDHPMIQKHADLVAFMRNLLEDDSILIRSVDTQGPTVDVRGGAIFESMAVPEALQNRILRDMPAGECVDACAESLREALAR
ncbi:ABC transporter substrate-binding protein [Algihabitans albus]|uniref:ABC transporter substrate-binding protein n=1 Tax=Algihabitans albus TaxID=2164067 RepID=UPI000E5D3C1B|nr:extracellular solute-binding protein [Algihabitans albus]